MLDAKEDTGKTWGLSSGICYRQERSSEMNQKFVAFEAYCKKCKYEKIDGWKDPCNECLEIGAREGTVEPLRFEEKEDK